ncbi:hypothetical protein ACFVAJ_16755 [Agromyces sp. NPDC057679]|uniref:hypothetical protein n=1 Tax=Agromyces sp. NPDC057679 TaxID=3346207 RepID=UPI00366AAA8D
MRWVNPEKISIIEPAIRGVEPDLHLIARLKVEGVPEFESWVAKARDRSEVDSLWREFLVRLFDGSAD